MKATCFNHSDIRKYYEGTYILVPEACEGVLYVEKVNSSYIYVRDVDGESGGIELTEKGYVIGDVLPHKQFYQESADRAAFIQRKPARMWKKGVHSDNTTISVIQENGGFAATGINHQTLEAFHKAKGKFPKMADIPESFRSIAVSPRLCFLKTGSILLDSFCVGVFNPKKKVAIVMKEVLSALPTNLWEIKTV